MQLLIKMLTLLPSALYWLMNKIGLPKDVQVIVVHVAIVFATAFVAQIAGASIGHFNWPTLAALLVSAAAAGGSAVYHYLLDLVPSTEVKAASKRK